MATLIITEKTSQAGDLRSGWSARKSWSTCAAAAPRRPASLDDVAKVSGVGQSKLKRYGADMLKVVWANW